MKKNSIIFENLSVVIPSFNDNNRLKQCIEALQKQTIGYEHFSIIVVDNGSKSPPFELQEYFSNVSVLSELKPGSYNARNKALESLSSEFVAFTDSDCVPDLHWLEESISHLTKSKADALGGLIKLFPKDKTDIRPVEILDMLYSFDAQSYQTQGYCPTANLVVRRAAFEKVGVFDGTMMSGGDREWCNRVQNKGGVLEFSDASIVYHPARYTLSEYFTRRRRLAHGAWGKREKDLAVAPALSISSFMAGLLPPVKRFGEVSNFEGASSRLSKFKACLVLYLGKIYFQYEILKCKLGLVKTAERR